MFRVSTSGSYSAVLANLMTGQARQAEAGEEISSQKKGSNLKDYAKDAQLLTSMRTVHTRQLGYLDQNKLIADKLTVQDMALNKTADAALGAREAIAQAIATGRADTLTVELQEHLRDAAEALNTQYGGKYVFAGGLIDTKPVTASDLSDLTAAPAISDLFHNDDFVTPAKLDDATTVATGMHADDLGTGLFQVLKTIKAFNDGAGGPLTGKLTDAQVDFLKTQLAPLDAVHEDLTVATAQNGLIQKRVDDVADDLTVRSDSMEGMIGDLSGADVAAAITRLEQAQTSLQATAQVFSTLQQSSLLNLLQS